MSAPLKDYLRVSASEQWTRVRRSLTSAKHSMDGLIYRIIRKLRPGRPRRHRSMGLKRRESSAFLNLDGIGDADSEFYELGVLNKGYIVNETATSLSIYNSKSDDTCGSY